MTEKNLLSWLQRWYLNQCNGKWEHSYGVKIDTLDNPGWRIIIDLIGTNLEKQRMNPVEQELSDDNWIYCSIVDGKFQGCGGAENFLKLIEIFKDFADSYR